MIPADDQIEAILGPDIFRWACSHMPDSKTIDDTRFRDFITVNEEDVYAYVLLHGFDARVVAERDDARRADDKTCLVPEPDGRFRVYYSERGQKSQETILASEVEARREVVRRQMRLARIMLNHRYRLAHPDEDLPSPDEMD